jgi:hypothetical protein
MFLSAVSLLLCVALCVLCVRSYYRVGRWYWYGSHQSYGVTLFDGRLVFCDADFFGLGFSDRIEPSFRHHAKPKGNREPRRVTSNLQNSLPPFGYGTFVIFCSCLTGT